MAILPALTLALLLGGGLDEVSPSGLVLTGVGLHAHESPLPAWAVEVKLGPRLGFECSELGCFELRIAPGWGMEYNSTRPLEHFGLFELGLGANFWWHSFEYLIGAQVGTFAGHLEPAFRHGVSWRILNVFGPEIQHYVAQPGPTSDGHPRQVVRIMFSVDVAFLIYSFVSERADSE